MDEAEEFEFRRRAEAERAVPPKSGPPPAQHPTLLGTAGRALWNAPMDAAETVKGVMMSPMSLGDALMHPQRTWGAVKDTAHKGAEIGAGMMQQVRELSPPESRGSAPAMDKSIAQTFEQQHLTKDALLRSIGDHPIAAALTVAPGVGAAARAAKLGDALGAVGQGAGRVAGATGRGIRDVLDAGATPASEKVRAAALGKILAQQTATADVEALAAQKKAADVPLRAQMEAAANAQAAAGIGVSDVPEAQSLVAFLKGQLNPRGKVVTVPTAEQARLYRDVIGALSPKGRKAPSLETIQNLRRKIAEPVHGDPQGYGAVADGERKKIVKDLHDVEEAYTGGASKPVRENYAAYKAAEEQADEMAKMKNTLMAQAVLLDELPAKAAAAKAQGIVQSLAKKGVVSEADYRDFMDLANAATDAKGKSAFRKRLALFGAASAGVSAGGAALGGHATGILP